MTQRLEPQIALDFHTAGDNSCKGHAIFLPDTQLLMLSCNQGEFVLPLEFGGAMISSELQMNPGL